MAANFKPKLTNEDRIDLFWAKVNKLGPYPSKESIKIHPPKELKRVGL